MDEAFTRALFLADEAEKIIDDPETSALVRRGRLRTLIATVRTLHAEWEKSEGRAPRKIVRITHPPKVSV